MTFPHYLFTARTFLSLCAFAVFVILCAIVYEYAATREEK